MRKLEGIQPERVFYYFEEICGIPHGSGNIWQISNYLKSFASDHGLDCLQDEMGNILIRKAGSPGYETSAPVILQGHMDMVCEKRADVEHDFLKDGLCLSVQDGFVSANGTTLGGDDGIAVAYALAILEDDTLRHPPLEILITVDEEIGLLGAAGFDCTALKGKRLINLDSEAEGSLWVSCAGGMTGVSRLPVRCLEGTGEALRIRIAGLTGGHSGAEIDKKRASAVSLMGRLLLRLGRDLDEDLQIAALSGGTKDNAIPREAEVLVLTTKPEAVKEICSGLEHEFLQEYAGSDEKIRIETEAEGEKTLPVLHQTSLSKVVFFLAELPFGIQKMSGSVEGLVETSLNPGIMTLTGKELCVQTSIRSSVDCAKDAVSDKVRLLTEFLGGEYETEGVYPAWEYRKDSPLRDQMTEIYREMFGKDMAVVAIHAGLECGLFYRRIDDLDCVSLGPDIHDIHTSEERLDIASVERMYRYLVRVLEAL